MNNLLWFDGITLETTIDKIGWTYVLLTLLVVILVVLVFRLVKLLQS